MGPTLRNIATCHHLEVYNRCMLNKYFPHALGLSRIDRDGADFLKFYIMNDLIKALTILSKYIDSEERWPTYCEHELFRVNADPADVSEEDIKALEELGFFPDEESFISYRFGS